MRTKTWLTILTVSLAILLLFKLGDAGDRRNIEGWMNNGIYTHFTLLDPGECDEHGCVMYEKETGYLHQFIDKNNDGVCDVIVVWKPLVDPTWGTYYSLYETKTCNKVL